LNCAFSHAPPSSRLLVHGWSQTLKQFFSSAKASQAAALGLTLEVLFSPRLDSLSSCAANCDAPSNCAGAPGISCAAGFEEGRSHHGSSTQLDGDESQANERRNEGELGESGVRCFLNRVPWECLSWSVPLPIVAGSVPRCVRERWGRTDNPTRSKRRRKLAIR